MGAFTNYAENKISDFFRGQGLTLPASWYFGLASAAGEGSATELAGTGYARVAVARSLANFAGTQGAGTTLASNGTSHTTSNNAAISWGNPGGSWGTANYVVLYDDTSAGNAWIYVPISAIIITAGSPNPVQIGTAVLSLVLGASGGLSDYLANALIDLLFRAQAFTWPATVYFGIYTVTPSNAGGGTECSGGAYARASLVPSLAAICGTQSPGSTAASAGTGGRISNNASITFPAPSGADWGTAVAAAMLDASSGGNFLFWRALAAARTINDGGAAPSFAADTFGITLD